MRGLKHISHSRRAVYLILGGIILVAAIVFLGILPTRMEIQRLDQEAIDLRAGIEEQKLLYPLYASLLRKVDDKSDFEMLIEELGHEPEPVNVDNAAGIFSRMAQSAGMNEAYFTPVPESLTREAGTLLMDGNLKGELDNFRDFLLKVSSWEYFSRFELLEIQSRIHGSEYNLRMWMSIN